MPIKNSPYTVSYYVEDLQNGGGITGDSLNHTLRLLADGALVTPTGTITEPDSTNLKGWYSLFVNANENTGDIMVVGGVSSTTNVAIRGYPWFNETIANSGIPGAVWDESTTGHTNTGTFGQQVKTDIDNILQDTNELQSNQGAWATATGFATHTDLMAVSGSVLDVNVVQISGEPVSVYDVFDANVVQISGEPVSVYTEFDANVVSVSGENVTLNDFKSTADLTQTNNDISSIISTLGIAGSGLTALPWNSTWDSEVQSEVTDALNVYDAPNRTDILSSSGAIIDSIGNIPTVSEFNARTLPSGEYFNSSEDVVAHVTLVDTVTTNSDMRGTDNAATHTDLILVSGSVGDSVWSYAIRELSTQNWSTHSAADVYTAFGTGSNLTNVGLSISGNIRDILEDTNELQTNQSNWLTATGFATQGDIISVSGILIDRTLPSGTYTNISSIISANVVQISGEPVSVVDIFDANVVQISGAPLVDFDSFDANVVSVSGEYVSIDDFQSNVSTVASEVADAVWNELLSDHTSEGSAGQALITASGIMLDSLNIGSGIALTRQLNNWGLVLLNHLRDVGIEP